MLLIKTLNSTKRYYLYIQYCKIVGAWRTHGGTWRSAPSVDKHPLIGNTDTELYVMPLNYGTCVNAQPPDERKIRDAFVSSKNDSSPIKAQPMQRAPPKHNTVDNVENDEDSMDWWRKYLPSFDAMTKFLRDFLQTTRLKYWFVFTYIQWTSTGRLILTSC